MKKEEILKEFYPKGIDKHCNANKSKNKQLVNELKKLTSFLNDNATTPERLYCLRNNTKPNICECGNNTKFKNSKEGYFEFCCVKCAQTSKKVRQKVKESTIKSQGGLGFASKKIAEKIKQTNLKKYGKDNPLRNTNPPFEKWKNQKPVKEILEDIIITNYFKEQVTNVLENRKVTINRMRNLAIWVKYQVEDDYLKRFDKLLKHPKNDSSSKTINILRYGEKEGLRRFEEKTKSCAQTEENMIKKYGKKEGLKRWNEYRNKISFANSEEGYIAKHGEIEGKKKFKKQCERNSGNLTLERKIELHGEKEGKKKFEEMCEVQKNKHSLENYIRLYGEEEGTKKWNDICEMHSYKNSLAYYIEKYGEEEGRKRIKKVKATTSLETLTKKHGEEEGYKKYIEFNKMKLNNKENFINRYGEEEGLIKWNMYCSGFSLIANELFESLNCKDAKFGINEERIDLNKNEYQEINQSFFKPDFLFNNKIIEFFGDYWHANPDIYDDEEYVVKNGYTAAEIRLKDKKRIEILKRKGYSVKVVWEKDYNQNKQKIIKECLKFLNN